jgi:site-specific DNA-methyltransferase (adenine-specific)
VLAERLIKLFSFAGDTVLDPFGGTGSTAVAAVATGRNSISVEIEPSYVDAARKNIEAAVNARRTSGAIKAQLIVQKTRRKRHGARIDVQATRKVS